MSTGWPILSAIIFLPMLGALFILAIHGEDEIAVRNARYVALWTTMITFLLSLVIWIEFDSTTHVFQFEEKREWLGNSINYRLGVDGISMLFVILTTFLMPLCVLASWTVVQSRVKAYMIAFLVPAARLCQLQIFPLHAAWLGAHAAGDNGHVLGGGHHRYPGPAGLQVPTGNAGVAVVCFPCILCGEDAHVAGPHLAS
jgi:formate hydrogenlyase subunit 3/multisubunit Na+/H+ antiporter MnhD subunit